MEKNMHFKMIQHPQEVWIKLKGGILSWIKYTSIAHLRDFSNTWSWPVHMNSVLFVLFSELLQKECQNTLELGSFCGRASLYTFYWIFRILFLQIKNF